MHIAIVTAGGAGMYCGSCMHDNTWARALIAAGADVTLIPTYTPIRVDEKDQSLGHVFFGGINVYLERYAAWRMLPRVFTRWLDAPWLLGLATRFGVSNDAKFLGEMTLEMLAGEQGPHRASVEELVKYLCEELRPDVICFSNALLAGAVPALKQQFDGPVFCVLQGDDVFLEDLIEPYRQQAIERMQALVRHFDGFIVHSGYYRDFMARYLQIPLEKFYLLPLGIDLTGHDGLPRERNGSPFTVGYFARVCPEKGLHQLVDAFRLLHARHPETRLRVGGYLGKRDQKYFEELSRETQSLGNAFEYIGSPDRTEKVRFIQSLDVLSVPTVYHEPKGLYILEALANGIPVVQPRHGAFPELIDATGGGVLVEPGDPEHLAQVLEELMHNDSQRLQLARSGYERVRQQFDPPTMARRSLEIFSKSVSTPPVRAQDRHSPGVVRAESVDPT